MNKKQYQSDFALEVLTLLSRFPPIQNGKKDSIDTEKINGWYYSMIRTVWSDGVFDILIQRRNWNNQDRPRTKREYKSEGIWIQKKDKFPQHQFTLTIDEWQFTNVMKC